MIKKNKNSTAIIGNLFCKKCGWPVIEACCNDEFENYEDAKDYDWWAYCSNKGCKRHDGEGAFQNLPEWVC